MNMYRNRLYCSILILSCFVSPLYVLGQKDSDPIEPVVGGGGCFETPTGCLNLDLTNDPSIPDAFAWGHRAQSNDAANQATASGNSSSINWTIVAPLIAGAVFTVVLFVAVLIYARRRKDTARRLSHESQLEGVVVETLTPTPVIEKETRPVEGQTNVTITTEQVPVVTTLGETQA